MRRNATTRAFLLLAAGLACLPDGIYAAAARALPTAREESTERAPQSTASQETMAASSAQPKPTDTNSSNTNSSNTNSNEEKAESVASPGDSRIAPSRQSLVTQCEADLKAMPGAERAKNIAAICEEVRHLDGCASVNGTTIYHFEKNGDPAAKSSQSILVFSLVHGDELQSGSVALSWLQRLQEIQPRNRWRVVPVMNPDGWKLRTRTNAAGVDVNRNFPSKDWDELAVKYWKTKAGGAERRFPGKFGGSEPETQCAMKHIDDFKPNFVISVHTPLGVLDFDGPKVAMPKFNPLPWVSLGNFPGSLGRYLWVDRQIPVLTVELKNQKLYAKHFEEFDKLQDITGTVAIQAEKVLKKKSLMTESAPETSRTETSL